MNHTAPDKHDSGERGWVLLTAMSLLTIMTIVGLASLAIVDTQTKRSRQQRERESTLNMAEAALYQQGFKLAQQWPTADKPATDCSSAVASANCPAAAQVLANSTNVDTATGSSWTTVIRDNGGALCSAYVVGQQDAAQYKVNRGDSSCTKQTGPACPGPCRYDFNEDKTLWVRSQSTVRGKVRTIVAQLKLEQIAESVPQTAVTAGGINTGNQGAQVKIFAVGSQVVVRCDPNASSGNKNPCVSDNTAIQPAAVQGAVGNLMTASQVARFKARAIADGTYYPGCPKTGAGGGWDLSGQVVFVDQCYDQNAKLDFNQTAADGCALPAKPAGAGNGLAYNCINTNAKPGLLIWHCGGFGTAGKGTFVGVMYFVNGSDGTCPTSGAYAPRGESPPDCSTKNNGANNVLEFSGGLGVLGAVAIDGNGCLVASANGIQVQFDPNVFGAVASYGTVGLVQKSWREILGT